MSRLFFGKRILVVFVCFFLFCSIQVAAQKRRPTPKPQPFAAVVVDERLSVLRFEPSLSAIPMQRMRNGRTMLVTGEKPADGVRFYRVQLTGEKTGWVQSDAVVSNAKRGDDERFTRLIRAESGFDQIELVMIFLENFPRTSLRPAILLLAGDLLEENAARLSREAARKLQTADLASNPAPVHSFYLNFSGLDRFRRLGAVFTFDAATKEFHHDGAMWREIVQKYPNSAESKEAQKRLESITTRRK